METSFTERIPPPFDGEADSYPKWKKLIKLWEVITDVARTKHGALIISRLDAETQDTILEFMNIDEIKEENGVEKIISHLDRIFLKDAAISAFEEYEQFKLYYRPAHLSIHQYCNEFHKRLIRIENSGTQLSQPVLAQKLLKAANLSKREELLITATTDMMVYEQVAKQLKKVFNSSVSNMPSNTSAVTFKEELSDTLYGSSFTRMRFGQHQYEQNVSTSEFCREGCQPCSYNQSTYNNNFSQQDGRPNTENIYEELQQDSRRELSKKTVWFMHPAEEEDNTVWNAEVCAELVRLSDSQAGKDTTAGEDKDVTVSDTDNEDRTSGSDQKKQSACVSEQKTKHGLWRPRKKNVATVVNKSWVKIRSDG